jgi:hypothetical protein
MDKMMDRTVGTYLVNDARSPLRYGEVNLINPPRRERRGLPEKRGKLCRTVISGFCGTDWELMQMGMQGLLTPKFPPGQQRLINGHEGVVWVPDEGRYAIILIRGGDANDPSRFESDEGYFEYGCDGADGLMSLEGYYHPDMLLKIPEGHLAKGKVLDRKLAQRLIFSDPMACMLFQCERLEDLFMGHNWRVYGARGLDKMKAMDEAVKDGFSRMAIYGLGSAGMMATMAIKDRHPHANIVAVGRTPPGGTKDRFLRAYWPEIQYLQAEANPAETARAIIKALEGRPRAFLATSGNAIESTVAFQQGLLDNNGIYASFSLGPIVNFDSMPFGFRNQLIYGAINFRRDHMEAAIDLLCRLPADELVREYPLSDLADDPSGFYDTVFRGAGRAVKSAVVWNEELIR